MILDEIVTDKKKRLMEQKKSISPQEMRKMAVKIKLAAT